ncbi:hypothetical protein M5689_022592 [Euphorbia peplus]|nr:hypothetical protein M5689_022592 [Euphorbia peplus]
MVELPDHRDEEIIKSQGSVEPEPQTTPVQVEEWNDGGKKVGLNPKLKLKHKDLASTSDGGKKVGFSSVHGRSSC